MAAAKNSAKRIKNFVDTSKTSSNTVRPGCFSESSDFVRAWIDTASDAFSEDKQE